MAKGPRFGEYHVKNNNNKTKKKKPRSRWTDALDKMLLAAVLANEPKEWRKIAVFVPTKTGDQCNQRWHRAVNPKISRAPFTTEEDTFILAEVAASRGCPKWSKIAKTLKVRTDQQVRHRYNTLRPKVSKAKPQPLPVWTFQQPPPPPPVANTFSLYNASRYSMMNHGTNQMPQQVKCQRNPDFSVRIKKEPVDITLRSVNQMTRQISISTVPQLYTYPQPMPVQQHTNWQSGPIESNYIFPDEKKMSFQPYQSFQPATYQLKMEHNTNQYFV